MPKVPNIFFRTKITKPDDFAFLLIICGMAIWVGIRCIYDTKPKDGLSLAINIGFLVSLAWRGWRIIEDNKNRTHEFLLLLTTLIWTTWTAHRGLDFFLWWLPSIVLTIFIASSEIIFPIVSLSVMLVSVVLLLADHISEGLEFLGSTVVLAGSVAVYRRFKDVGQNDLTRRIRNLQMAQSAAGFWHMEIGENDQVEYLSEPLTKNLEIPDPSRRVHFSNIFHPADHLSIDRARFHASRLSVGQISSMASCDCRLVRKTGSTIWVHAQFVRSSGVDNKLIVTLLSIEERLQMEELLRDSQRKLASQAIEISTQFNSAKSALHARQEVERLAQHDLRSPLKSIESAAALLRKGRVLSNTEEHLLTSIERTAARALSMVTMSLDLYRMEEGTFRFVPETIDLVVIGRNVIGELINHARSKNIHLEFNASVNNLKATGNHLLTFSIVENLVRNALEAAPENSTVTMAIYQGARVGLLIHNEGAVHESIRDEFFEKYATHGKRGGLGLGTYSARLIARAQGGDLTMSTSTERGTLLMLKLNRARVEPKDDRSDRLHANSFGPSLPGNLVDIALSPESEAKETPIELLVVEDDEYNWLLLLSWLPRHVGARRAINGRDAIEALTLRRPDIVVMDLEMPIMDGFEALSRIREMQSSAAEEASIIYAFTGYDDIETIEKAKKAGFDGILTKPVRQEDFEEILKIISSKTATSLMENKLWIEKSFIEAFPSFIESRRALVSEIERSAESGDFIAAKRAAHTLAGSPAIHGFDEGISICREISGAKDIEDIALLKSSISILKKILSNPIVR